MVTGMANEQNPLTKNHVEEVVANDNYGVDPAVPRPGSEDNNNNVRVVPVHIPNINDVACFVRQILTLIPQLITLELIFI